MKPAALDIGRYLLRRLTIWLVMLLNLGSLLFLIIGLHRILAQGAADLSGTFSLIAALLGFYTVWKMAQSLVLGRTGEIRLPEQRRRFPSLIGHLPFWGFIPILWWIILPVMSDLNRERGIGAKEQQRYRKAISNLRQSLYQEDDNPKAHYRLADIYEELADIDSAMHHYRMGVHVDTDYPTEPFNNLARLLLTRGDMNGALDLLDLAWETNQTAALCRITTSCWLRGSPKIRHCRARSDTCDKSMSLRVSGLPMC